MFQSHPHLFQQMVAWKRDYLAGRDYDYTTAVVEHFTGTDHDGTPLKEPN